MEIWKSSDICSASKYEKHIFKFCMIEKQKIKLFMISVSSLELSLLDVSRK